MKLLLIANLHHRPACFRLCWAFGLILFTITVTAKDELPRLGLSSAPNISLRNEVDQAIQKGLVWLERNQDTNGIWSAEDQPAISALALTAFGLRPGRHSQKGDPAVVTKGYSYLMSCVQTNGGIYRDKLPSYNTSISLTALVVGKRPEHQTVIAKARRFLIGLQNDSGESGKPDDVMNGGIGYGIKDKLPDLSNTAAALEAISLSRRPWEEKETADARDLNWKAAIQFIQNCQNLPSHNSQAWVADDPANKGGFIYHPGRSNAGETNLAGRVALRSYGSMSYAGLLSYIYADLKHDDPRVMAVMEWLRANYTLDENPAMGQQGLYYYYHTMAKALTVHGVDTLETKDGRRINWREQLALKLINLQHIDGCWSNENGRWMEKDPVLTTAYSLIALEMSCARL